MAAEKSEICSFQTVLDSSVDCCGHHRVRIRGQEDQKCRTSSKITGSTRTLETYPYEMLKRENTQLTWKDMPMSFLLGTTFAD